MTPLAASQRLCHRQDMKTTEGDLRRDWSEAWDLEPGVTLLNHGSYGACPRAVLDAQHEWRRRLEKPRGLLFEALFQGRRGGERGARRAFLGAKAEDLALVANASSAVNAVLRSLALSPGDEILLTDVTYPACRNAADYVAARSGAKVVIAEILSMHKRRRARRRHLRRR